MNTNKYYMQIVQTILRQEDAETKNPIDVGIECGYPEEDVRDAIEFLKEMEKRRSGTEVVQVIVQGQILEINIYDMTVELVEKIKDAGFNEKVKNNIYVCTTKGKSIARWKYLKTGEKGQYKDKKPIKDLIIVEQNIVLLLNDKIVKITETGEQKDLHLEGIDEVAPYMLKEIGENIYIINTHTILRIDKEIENVECIVNCNEFVEAIYLKNGQELCYIVENGGQRKCYTENGNIDNSMFPKKILDNLSRRDVVEFLETKNYYCMGDMRGISKENNQEKELGKIVDYTRKMITGLKNELFRLDDNYSKSQIVSLYSQDKIIYVKEDNQIVIMDLKNGYTNYVVMP